MRQEFYEAGGLIHGGKLQVAGRSAFDAAMRRFPEGHVIVRVEVSRPKRSSQQNRLYWKCFVQPISEHTGYEPDEIHAYLKQRFLPMQHLMIQSASGEVIDEADVEATTTKLTKKEFTEYMRAIETWAAQDLGIIVGAGAEAA